MESIKRKLKQNLEKNSEEPKVVYSKNWVKYILIDRHCADSVSRKIKGYKKFLAGCLSPSDQYAVSVIPLQDQSNVKEVLANISLQGAFAVISSFEEDIMLSEELVLEQLRREGTPITEDWDETKCIAIPQNTYVFPGQKVYAEIIPWAVYNKSAQPSVKTRNGHIVKVEYGVADWAGNAKYLGINRISGTVIIHRDTQTITKPWSFEYVVIAPGAHFHIDNSNVCYLNVPNSMSISVPGYEPKDILLRVPGAKVTKMSDGQFEILVTKPAPKGLWAMVEGKNKKGETSLVGTRKLIVKDLPLPLALLGDKGSGQISLADLKLQDRINLITTDSDFVLDYSVKSYSFSVLKKNTSKFIEPITIIGAGFLSDAIVKATISAAEPGDKIIIEDIIVRDQSNREIGIAPIFLNVI